MTLSLDGIYQPVAEFFLHQFETDAGSPILFRFDKFGSVVSDQDFIDPNHPELGYLPALAMEKFSDLVNHIPVDTHDGMDILLSADAIDNTYFFRLLMPAIPLIPHGIDDTTKQAIIDAFSVMKENALKIWNSLKVESITGLMLQYKPSLATPQIWYDKSKNEIWTHHSFQVTETDSTPVVKPIDQLWKLKLNDEVMAQILDLPDLKKKPLPDPLEPPQLDIADRILTLRIQPEKTIPDATNISVESLHPQVTGVPSERLVVSPEEPALHDTTLRDAALPQPSRLEPERLVISPGGAQNINIAAGNLIPHAVVARDDSVTLHTTYLQQSSKLDVSKKLLVNQYLGKYAPTDSVQTTSISISFDYCLVNIRRPWYEAVFINDKSWYIPTVPKGLVTSSSAAGSFPLMPIGFVAIRNLNIEADWTEEDRANASRATSLGPFKVTTDIVNNTLSHPGLQIIGWILQKMPDLPPNDAPA
jgi:hypothetical protein